MVDNRDYLVELGYVDNDNTWHALARSTHVRVPACPSVVNQYQALGVGAAATGAVAGAALVSPPVVSEPARVILTPRDCRQAYAYWEIPVEQVDRLRADNRSLKVRLYDVTELPGGPTNGHNSLQEFDADFTAQGDLHLPIAVDDRDYLVEIGYADGLGHWQALAKSDSVRVPACIDPVSLAPSAAAAASFAPTSSNIGGSSTLDDLRSRAVDLTSNVGQTTSSLVDEAGSRAGAALAGGAAAVAGLGAAARSVFDRPTDSVNLEPAPTSGIGTRSDLGAESKIILVPRGSHAAYAYWETAEIHKQTLKNLGGRVLTLRIHDATNLELDNQAPHNTQEYILQETDQDKHVLINVPDRDYVAELGYLTDAGQWLQLIRSLHVRVPQS
jgi:phosphate transport system substrate-binding protein